MPRPASAEDALTTRLLDEPAADGDENRALAEACERGDVHAAMGALSRGASGKSDRCLQLAVSKQGAKSEDLVALLLASGANPRARDPEGLNSLHLACATGDNLALLESLLQYDADPNAATTDGRTPLSICCASAREGRRSAGRAPARATKISRKCHPTTPQPRHRKPQPLAARAPLPHVTITTAPHDRTREAGGAPDPSVLMLSCVADIDLSVPR